ncbi:amidase family protein [Aspergillus saccharolyticus JOP 1030-1]|uniref:Amidase family protein n=1 Tax=Aspergillus saccharolyticus JOP 1030-1 TaxID=1450539 RepID=A0A319AU20_9EURO|nr:amidase family protein [Aspergillus saccharolyticus JOP 1030-1]PYH49662.1 amidase family protein [Aspergillus saccharolyticus JOP 1030-1]
MLLHLLCLVILGWRVNTTLAQFQNLEHISSEGITYELGDVLYFANSEYPQATGKIKKSKGGKAGHIDIYTPVTVIVTNQSVVTGAFLEETIDTYLNEDDVFTEQFLTSIYITSTSSVQLATMDNTSLEYLNQIGVDQLYLDSKVFRKTPNLAHTVRMSEQIALQPGPYTILVFGSTIQFLDTYRVYVDEYRSFITGSYPLNDGLDTYAPLESMYSRTWAPIVPVPSRIRFWNDPRPLAGKRVAIKDLFDIKGLQTSAGSQAWIRTHPVANSTAPAIQRLIDLGAVLVGKYKLAQFASSASPWDWTDAHHPFNPRGDGYLTCAGSSSGGGCSIAAYAWLDHAIGTDTGASMRRPAAVSGTYGNRPSQGMISLEGAVPLSWAADTIGVFGRDPISWSHFARSWYSSTPELHQNTSVTGLPPLSLTENHVFPSRILYPDEYFPMSNPAAQDLLDSALSKMTTLFNMTITHFNLSATITDASIFPDTNDNWDRLANDSIVINTWPQYHDVAQPLISAWADQHEGRFPPVDPPVRSLWPNLDFSVTNAENYDAAVQSRAVSIEWFEREVLLFDEAACSEALLVCDAGTGGLPSFRESKLNEGPNASFLYSYPEGAMIPCVAICALFGCADFTIPLGQVPYLSPVTKVTEQWPVVFNLIARRGCDFMLFDLVERMAEEGILAEVNTGMTAY